MSDDQQTSMYFASMADPQSPQRRNFNDITLPSAQKLPFSIRIFCNRRGNVGAITPLFHSDAIKSALLISAIMFFVSIALRFIYYIYMPSVGRRFFKAQPQKISQENQLNCEDEPLPKLANIEQVKKKLKERYAKKFKKSMNSSRFTACFINNRNCC
jgi:predicted membrane protein